MPFKSLLINDRLFTGILLALIAAVITFSGALVRFDNLYYDLSRYFSHQTPPDDVVIVAIDESSLTQLGRWPWSRSVHAELLNKLKSEQPLAIGLDVIFSEPEIQNPEADRLLAEAIKQVGNVVLPVLLEVPFAGAGIKQTMPLDILSAHAALGRVHVPLDQDGIARGFYLWEGLGTANLPHFAQSILQVANLLPKSISFLPPADANEKGRGQLQKHDYIKIPFIGPPGSFQRISYAKVLSGNYPAGYFVNKLVLVGATAVGMGDALPTPVSASAQPMPGVEFHANAIQALRNSTFITTLPIWAAAIFCALFAVVPLVWLPKLSPLKSLVAIAIYYGVFILIVLALPRLFNLWLPPAGALLAILFAYPIWSWRKLESAQAYLDVELQNLQDDLSMLGVQQKELDAFEQDPLQARISKVKLTTAYLRNLQRDRNDTLAFISHDIRAPLSSAIMLLKEVGQTKQSERISHMLARANNMAENFLQVSRAEMANPHKFQHMDLIGLVQQAVDEMYEIAKAKNIKIKSQFPEADLWVKGDFGLLQRAINNVLLNAIKYSPDGATIEVSINQDADKVLLKVKDFGPGIAAEKIPELFKRFSRAEGSYQASDGSGLGLYFVDITMKKHSGTVDVESILENFTSVTLTLPLMGEMD